MQFSSTFTPGRVSKKAYQKPALKRVGTLKTLTKALKTGSNTDGFGGTFA